MTSVANPPRLSALEAAALAAELYGLTAQATPLTSERDQNFLLRKTDDSKFVLKVANAAESRAMLEAENAVMRHLAGTRLCPAVVPTRTGEDMASRDGHFVRLITWIGGRPLGETARQTGALREDLGRAVATINRALADFDHPALHRAFHWDLAGAPATIRAQLPQLRDRGLAGVVAAGLASYDDTVAPFIHAFPRSVIHGDANDYNVLVDARTQRVTGIVDFGDMVVSHTVNDVAIAMSYASLGAADPIGAAADVLRGYHAVHPLHGDEVHALFPLMWMRLCLSVCLADTQIAARPDDEYLAVSQAPIRETLPRLAAVHPRLAFYRFREACGLPPVPIAPRIVDFLRRRAGRFASVVGRDLATTPVLGLDLSAGSPLVASDPVENAAEPFGRRVFAAMREAGVEIGAGGYNEARLIYAADAYSPAGRVTDERRTIHVGLDLTMAAGTPVHAPFDAFVHGFEHASARLDYGPVIVLRHEIPGGLPAHFFTLYGHLDPSSLQGLTLGRRIRAGEQFAAIGAPPDNGDWWPHLHFQVITDLLDIQCNFIGVAPASQRATWLSLCPDPNLMLGIPEERLAQPRPTTEALLERRARYFGGNVRLSYGDRPLHAVRGWMQYLFDDTGRTYIDAYNNVPHAGHAHPRITRAVADQLATLNTNSRYVQDVAVEYAEALAATFPAPLRVCYFTASGSEANELALRLARVHTRRRELIVMEAAYHGHTTAMIDVSPYKSGGPGGTGSPKWVHVSPIPDVYRGPYRANDPDAGLRYANDVGAIVDRLAGRPVPYGLCGYLAETCPSVGGQIVMPPQFLTEVYRVVRAAGGVCIADEVQTGLGRIGSHFWAFERQAVVPDIVVLGKPLANGYPLGAVVTTPEIAASFDNGMEFFSTFGGSTAACAAGLATLRATIDEGLQAHAADVGEYLIAGLRDLQTRHALIGDVRGSGLFIGVELVRDRETLTPAAEEASAIVNRMRELGVLTGTDGPLHNVIKIRGPMPLARNDTDVVLDALGRALEETRDMSMG